MKDTEIVLNKALDKREEPVVSMASLKIDAFAQNCPLWTYILAEAARSKILVETPTVEKTKINTPQLGPVGGRIVAEVFLGLMFGDPNSMLSLEPYWTPSNPDYKLKDFVKYALGM